jgi:NAD(P)-dependent dehydrogenase (short-subunit alcohol dehydrogenase family)
MSLVSVPKGIISINSRGMQLSKKLQVYFGTVSSRPAGKIALITTAGAGIGAETARLFACEGAAVIGNDVVPDRAHGVVASIRNAGGSAVAAVADISAAGEVNSMFRDAERGFGGIDILVNNAKHALHLMRARAAAAS